MDLRRIRQLLHVLSRSGPLLPGDTVKVPGQKGVLYMGVVELGDVQVSYWQVHVFRLHDGSHVFVESPTLNRTMGKWVF